MKDIRSLLAIYKIGAFLYARVLLSFLVCTAVTPWNLFNVVGAYRRKNLC